MMAGKARVRWRGYKKRNKEREQYVKRHFGRSWHSFDNYHVCVDTGRLGIDGAADLIVHAARMRFGLRAKS